MLKERLYAGVLAAVLRVQKLDVHDIENVYPVYQQLVSDNQKAAEPGPDRRSPHCGSTRSYADSSVLPREQNGTQADSVVTAEVEPRSMPQVEERIRTPQADLQNTLQQKTDNEKLSILRNYLIAATAKDCSVMIALRITALSTSTLDSIKESGRCFLYRVGVVDLDRKPVTKIADHHEVDEHLWSPACAA